MILLASSCGLRIGAIPGLSVGSWKSTRICIRLPFMRTNLKSILFFVLLKQKKEIDPYLRYAPPLWGSNNKTSVPWFASNSTGVISLQ